MCLSMCVWICEFACESVCVFVRMHLCLCVRLGLCVCICVCICAYTSVFVCASGFVCMHLRICVSLCVRVCVFVRASVCFVRRPYLGTLRSVLTQLKVFSCVLVKALGDHRSLAVDISPLFITLSHATDQFIFNQTTIVCVVFNLLRKQ